MALRCFYIYLVVIYNMYANLVKSACAADNRAKRMKIERIDDNTIKCYISLEEMEQYQVEYTDFISRTAKAQELMHEIIKQAHDEVGYQPPKLAFEMQIMMVPEQGMVLTFSEKEPFDLNDQSKVEAVLNNLMELASKIAKSKGNGVIPDFAGGLLSGMKKPENEQNSKSGKKQVLPINKVEEAVFAFSGLAQLMDYADVIPSNVRVETCLYKMKDMYYLHMKKGRASYEKYSRACVQALEFASLHMAGEGCDELLKEHGECVISEKVLKKLRG